MWIVLDHSVLQKRTLFCMTAPEAGSDVDQELFRQVIGHFASGVTVIPPRHTGRRFGMTASPVASLSVEPPMLLACTNRRAPTRNAVSDATALAVMPNRRPLWRVVITV